MNTSYYRGSFIPALQSVTYEFDPTRGWLYRSTEKCFIKENLAAKQNLYASLGIASSLTSSHGVSTLEAVDATQQFTLDDWQIDGESQRNDLLSHPDLLAIRNFYLPSPDIISTMRTGLNNETSFEDLANNNTDGIATILTGDELALVSEFYNLYLAGTTEFENDADGTGYVLRHSTNVSNRWTQNIADDNVGQIYSTAELITEVTNAALWINTLPPRLVYKISNIPVPDPQLGYFWGWKKSRSRELTAANNRVNIITYYTLALWNVSVLYDAFE